MKMPQHSAAAAAASVYNKNICDGLYDGRLQGYKVYLCMRVYVTMCICA